MQRFAELYATLDQTRSTSAKIAAMRAYFAQTPPQDAAWGLYFLLGQRIKRTVAPTQLRAWVIELSALPPAVIEESYAHVGDLAETLALLIDNLRVPAVGRPSGRQPTFDTHQAGGLKADLQPACELALADCVQDLLHLRGADEALQRKAVIARWQALPFLQCLLFNKLLTGALRVGVSAGLAARALAEHAGLDTALIQARLMGEWQPSAETFLALLQPASTQRDPSQPYPFCLASPLDDAVEHLGPREQYLAEWKWDGIRGQLIRREQRTWLWSRGEELLDGRFPEIEAAAAALPDGTVLDGEVLAWNTQGVMPFAALQKRIGRKAPGKKILDEIPARFCAYDLIEHEGQDLRAQPLAERRQRLQALIEGRHPQLQLSEALIASDWNALAAARDQARSRGVEGLMLKRLDAPYVAGRKRGAWWKWKLGALTVDTVLVYAQSGHGRRSTLYTDYTLAVWDGGALVPVAKAYSGLSDAELTEMDRWIRAHTLEKFGPVRSVQPLQVFEIAFEGIQASPRHKSGIALRFPRIARWRRDKTVAEIDTLDALKKLL